MNRAYSILTVRAVEEANGVMTITGLATTPAPDRMGDIVKPDGAQFALPIPLLWQHNSDQPIGNVTKAKVTKAGIEIVAAITMGILDEIDRAATLIKAGLVRGLSIGFRGLDTEQIPNSWGVIFNSWEWLELSAVTIPANAEATITSIKSIDTEIREARGIKDEPLPEIQTAAPAATGKTVRVVKLNPARDRAKPFVIRQVRPLG